MVKLADTPDLGSGVARRAGSSPVIRTRFTHNPPCSWRRTGPRSRAPAELAEQGDYSFLDAVCGKVSEKALFALQKVKWGRVSLSSDPDRSRDPGPSTGGEVPRLCYLLRSSFRIKYEKWINLFDTIIER